MTLLMAACTMCMRMMRQSLGLMKEFLSCLRPQVLHAITGDVHAAQLLFQ